MSLTRKIAHNTLVQIIGRGGAGVLAVVAISLITRYLGTEGFGFYTTAISFLQFFGILIDFGLTMITVQMISERDDGAEKVVGNIVALRTVSAVIFLGIAPAIALFFPYPAVVKWGILITTLTFVSQLLLQTVSGVFQKHLAMHIPAAADFISRLFYVALVAILIYFKQGILSILFALALSNCLSLAIIYFYAGKFVPIKPMWDFALWKEILRRSWPIGLSIILNLIYLKADILLLSVFKSQSEVGLYGAPYKLIDALTMFAMLFMGLILPLLAAAWAKGDKERFAALFQKTFNLLVIFTIPTIVGAYYLSDKVMTFVAGADFAVSGKILTILTLGAGAVFIGSLFSHTIVAIDKQKTIIWGYLADAALSLVGYFIFIPKYSYLGAAWVTVFSETFIVLIGIIIVWRETKIRPKFIKILFKSLLAAIPMAFALRYLQNLQVLLAISIAAMIYVIFIVILKGISVSEIKQIVKIK